MHETIQALTIIARNRETFFARNCMTSSFPTPCSYHRNKCSCLFTLSSGCERPNLRGKASNISGGRKKASILVVFILVILVFQPTLHCLISEYRGLLLRPLHFFFPMITMCYQLKTSHKIEFPPIF